MNRPWTTVATFLLVAAGIAAELNLLRIFIGDWRAEHRRQRRNRVRARRLPADRRPTPNAISRPMLAGCLLATLPICIAANAQDTGAAPRPADADATAPSAPPPAPSEPAKSAISLQLNLDYTTAYFYRGIIQEDSGLILQPAAKLTINLFEEDDVKLDAFLGTWNSFHGQKTGASTRSDFTDYWYESDVLGGLTLTAGKVSLTGVYYFLTSPSDAYETVQEFDFTLAYDDSDLLGTFALHPYALFAFETGADASDGADSDTGSYLELGVAPGFSFDMGKTPVSISFPVSIGLSLKDYYQDAAGNDDTFGFAQVGVKASVPLPFGDRYGKWTLNAGVSGLFLGDHTADYNAGDHEEVVGTIGLQLNF